MPGQRVPLPVTSFPLLSMGSSLILESGGKCRPESLEILPIVVQKIQNSVESAGNSTCSGLMGSRAVSLRNLGYLRVVENTG